MIENLIQNLINGLIAGGIYALIALGYRPAEAGKMVRSVLQDGMSTEEVIKAALQGTVQ